MIGRPEKKPSAPPARLRLLVGAACAMLVAGWSLVAAATELGPPRHTIYDDVPGRPVPPDEAPVVDVPDLIPTAFPAFSDEMFKVPGWKRTPKVPREDVRTVSRYSGERASTVDYSFTVLPHTGKSRLNYGIAEQADFATYFQNAPHWNGVLGYNSGNVLTYEIDSPMLEHRLSFGSRTSAGPRWELLLAESLHGRGDFNMAFDRDSVTFEGTPIGTTIETANIADGRRRRMAVTASWALPARMAGRRVETLRVYGGWTLMRDRYSLYDHWMYSEPPLTGLYSRDRFDAAGPLLGASSTWRLKPHLELFADASIMRTKGGFNRVYEEFPALRMDVSNYGFGWDGRLGLRLDRGRSFWEVALAGFSFHQAGGTGSMIFLIPNTGWSIGDYTLTGESVSEAFNLTFTAGWRF